jgi:hypothetical protein
MFIKIIFYEIMENFALWNEIKQKLWNNFKSSQAVS